MRLWSIVVALVFALSLASACGGNGEPQTGDAGLPPGDMMAAFGDACQQDSDCMSNTCRNFMMLGNVCTALCTDNTMCPSGSQGQKCNMMGFCRP